jgi:hypothetical protein
VAGAEERAEAPGVAPPRRVEKAPRVAEGRAEWVAVAEPQGEGGAAVVRAAGDSLVEAEPRPGEEPPANVRRNIHRIYFPPEMICDNLDISLGESLADSAHAIRMLQELRAVLRIVGVPRIVRTWQRTPDSCLRRTHTVYNVLFLVHLIQQS